jgi:parallel beta-helix repeat protein
LGELPRVENAGTRIDGTGTSEALRNEATAEISGLRIRADDVTVQGFNISSFQRNGIEVYHVNRAQVIGCYIGWSGNNRGLVEILGGEGHVVSGCSLSNSRGHGIYLREGPMRVTISDNEITAGNANGIAATGYQIEITGNLIQGNVYAGIQIEGVNQCLIRDNQILTNGGSTYGDHGIYMEADNALIQIESSQFIGNLGNAIHLRYDSISRVTISACYFEGNEKAPIYLTTGANGGVQPPVIDSFDGTSLSGTAGSDGRVEVYSVDSATHAFLAQADVTGGSWSLELGESAASVAATFTKTDGSTSAFTAAAVP